MRRFASLLAFASALALALVGAGPAFPRIDHVVIVVEENRSISQIVGNGQAPYINSLIAKGALFTNMHAVTHPSQPNYFAMFAGLVDKNGDGCPPVGVDPNAPNLGSELLQAKRTFVGFAETMPSIGYTGCRFRKFVQKHTPWVQFENIPPGDSRPLSTLRSFDELPTVAMIIPNLDDDMHDGSIQMGDAWLRQHIAPLLEWGRSHNTLFILTWDEGVDPQNHIPLVFYGPMVKPGKYSDFIDHYAVLRTLEDIFHLAPTGKAAQGKAITDVWR